MKQTKIQVFAKKHYGIELTTAQLEIIALIAADPEQRIVQFGRKVGISTANKIALAYLQDGLRVTNEL